MTKKDYILIAEALKSARPPVSGAVISMRAWRAAVDALATALRKDNSAFDRARFYAAVLA